MIINTFTKGTLYNVTRIMFFSEQVRAFIKNGEPNGIYLKFYEISSIEKE